MAIILSFEALRLTEFIFSHGLSSIYILKIMFYMAVTFLPVLVPMSLLFSVLFAYSRLSREAELIAALSLGISGRKLALPGIAFGFAISLASLKINQEIAPWGTERLEHTIKTISQKKAAASIKSGVFSQGFFDMVIYANQVQGDRGLLSEVFIFDETNQGEPTTILANHGQLESGSTALGASPSATLRLFNGSLIRNRAQKSKIDFDRYDIDLRAENNLTKVEISKSGQTGTELRRLSSLETTRKDPKKLNQIWTEYRKRNALAWAALVFATMGILLGFEADKRSGKGFGFGASVLTVVVYWILFVYAESASKAGILPSVIGVWIPNSAFAVASGILFWRGFRKHF